MKTKIVIILICIVLISSGCSNDITHSNNSSTSQIANPSATKCVEEGYEYKIRTNNDGSQSGYCISSNNECEAWAYYKGECNLT